MPIGVAAGGIEDDEQGPGSAGGPGEEQPGGQEDVRGGGDFESLDFDAATDGAPESLIGGGGRPIQAED